MKRATREWVRKAEADFRGALRLASADEPFHEPASALRWAGKARDACRALLGLHPPRHRRKTP